MNIIDAWLSAKEGQTIARGNGQYFKWTKQERRNKADLHLAVSYAMKEYCLSADDWEVVKEKKTRMLVTNEEGAVVLCGKHGNQYQSVPIPAWTKVTIEWEE